MRLKKIKPIKLFKKKSKLLIGWNEWCSLPALNIVAIKAKIDTGAKTSAIHAFNIKPYKIERTLMVSFDIHPLQRNDKIIVSCHAPVIDERAIMSSNGHREHRYVIMTPIKLGDNVWEIEITLSDRDPLKFRMLLGRAALADRVIIDPHKKLIQGKIEKKELLKKYRHLKKV